MKLTTTLYLCAITTAFYGTVSASQRSSGGTPLQPNPQIGSVDLGFEPSVIQVDPHLPLGFYPRTAPKLSKQTTAGLAQTQSDRVPDQLANLSRELPEEAYSHSVLFQFHQQVQLARNSMIEETNAKLPKLVSESFKFKNAFLFQFTPKCNPWKKRVEAMTAVMAHYMKLLTAENSVYFARFRKGTNAQTTLTAYEKARYMRILLKLVMTRKGDVMGQQSAGNPDALYRVNNVASGLKSKLTMDLQITADSLKKLLIDLKTPLVNLLDSVQVKDTARFYQYGKFGLVQAAKNVADFELLLDLEMQNLLAFNNDPNALTRRYCTQRALTGRMDAIKYAGRTRTAKVSFPKAGLGMQSVPMETYESTGSFGSPDPTHLKPQSTPWYTGARQAFTGLRARMPTMPWNTGSNNQSDGSGIIGASTSSGSN